jgi:hypothetical protein
MWKPRSAAQRRAEQAADLNPDNGNRRPNEPPRPIVETNRCPGRVGGEHDFSQIHHDDPRGSGITTARCWYCSRLSPTSHAVVKIWRQQQTADTDPRRI